MEVIKKNEGGVLTAVVKGRLDTNSAPDLEKEITPELSGVNTLIFDFSDLVYIASAGLRVILLMHKTMNAAKKKFIIRNPHAEVMEIFEMTGFSSFLTIE